MTVGTFLVLNAQPTINTLQRTRALQQCGVFF